MIWIAIIVQRIANRNIQKDAENSQVVRILKEIIGRSDEVQALLVGFPLTAQTREIIARKIESISQNVEILRTAKNLITHIEYEWLVDSLQETVLEYEPVTNDFAAQNAPEMEVRESQRDSHSQLVLACNRAILTLSLS